MPAEVAVREAPQAGTHPPAFRRPAASVPSITGLRFSPHGIDATLVNISETGLLAECAERLKPGRLLTVVFEGTISVKSVEGRVARSSVSSIGPDHRLRYHVGLAFKTPIVLDDPLPAQAETLTAAVAPSAAPLLARNRW